MSHIRGVISYFHLLLGGSQHIHIFGENHTKNSNKSKCPNSQSFLEFIEAMDQQKIPFKVFIENPYCYDGYEIEPKLAEIPMNFEHSNISEIKRKHLDCLYGSRSECSLRSTQFIPSDVRNAKGTSKQLVEFQTFCEPLLVLWQAMKDGMKGVNVKQFVVSQGYHDLVVFLSSPAETLMNVIMKNQSSLLHSLFVQAKQQKMINNEMLLQSLFMLQEYYDATATGFQSRTKVVSMIQGTVDTQIAPVFECICLYCSMIMDTFILLNVLLLHPSLISTAILVGNTHAQIYVKIFTVIFGATIKEQGSPVNAKDNENEMCLRIHR